MGTVLDTSTYLCGAAMRYVHAAQRVADQNLRRRQAFVKQALGVGFFSSISASCVRQQLDGGWRRERWGGK
jgi:hypothetical protein